jgi:hypothetical protein
MHLRDVTAVSLHKYHNRHVLIINTKFILINIRTERTPMTSVQILLF